jgi:hypothetical protein
MNIEEKLKKANTDMHECLSCFDEYSESLSQIREIFDGVKIHRGLDYILVTEILDDISVVLEAIYDGYNTLGLITEDDELFDEDSFHLSKIERKIANGKIKALEDIPENLRTYFPSNQDEFYTYRDGLIDSDSAWDDIRLTREVLDETIRRLGEAPFSELLSGVNENIDIF